MRISVWRSDGCASDLTRERGLDLLAAAGRIDIATNGSIAVLGATSLAVLEVTSELFHQARPSAEEHAVLALSEQVATNPQSTSHAVDYIGDEFRISKDNAASLIELCKATALIDEVSDKGRQILFNSNTFRDGRYALKSMEVLKNLSPTDQLNLRDVHERLRLAGAMYDADVERILGADLYRKLISVGYFDRMEVSNSF